MLGIGEEKKKRTIVAIMSGKTDQKAGSLANARLRVSLRQLEVFAATARAGTVRAAADQVSRSQSAASATLVELEETLGAPLFDRVGRRLLLNANGRALLPKAMSLLDRGAELQHLFAAEHDAPLRLAASLTIGECLLPDLLADWKTAHPASPVHLMIGNTSEVITAVAAFDVDIGFIEGRQTHPQLIVHAWRSDELVIIAAPAHPLARGTVSTRQLGEATWALRERGSGTREAVDRWLLEHVGSLRVEFELGSPEAIKRLVAAGSALGCLPREAVARELEQGWLVELATRLPRASRRLAIVLHRDKHLGRGAEDFLRHCASFGA
jgi:DNA-binding transcriptional LysR family regulator